MSFLPSDGIGERIMSARRVLEFARQGEIEKTPGWQRDSNDWAMQVIQRLSEIPLEGDTLLMVGTRQNQRVVRHNDGSKPASKFSDMPVQYPDIR